MTSYLTSTDKPTAMKQPSSQQATTTADHEFDKMDVKELKRFISARGVHVSTYHKSELIQLAKAVASMNLPTDPDFENDSIELDDFLSNQTKSVTSMSAYWNPKPAPTHKPVPASEMKISHSTVKKKKRKVTPFDDSWIDSFDPRPMKHRQQTSFKEKIDFANKLRNIDPCSGILDFLQSSNNFDDIENTPSQSEHNISHLYVSSQAKDYVQANLDKLSENNLFNFAEEFLKALTFSANDIMEIN